MNKTSNNTEALIKHQVANDLETYLADFPKVSLGLNEITHKSGLSGRSLARYLKQQSTPQATGLIKLYKVLTDSDTDSDLKIRLPSIILSRIAPFLSDNEVLASGKVFSISTNKEFLSNKAFRYIYMSTACYFLTKERIGFLFGQSGEITLTQMIENDIVKIEKNGRIVSGNKRLILDADAFQLMAVELIQNHFHPKRTGSLGENIYRYHIESVDLDTYNELLKIDQDSSRAKIELLKQKGKSGDIPYWSIDVADNFLQTPLYPDTDMGVLQ